jgi:hypothetical protein
VPTDSARHEVLFGAVAFLAALTAIALGSFADTLLRGPVGVPILLVLTIVLIAALVVVDVPAAVDDIDGNTFSELLRAGGVQTAIFPWTIAVFAGRWFHPVDDLELAGTAGVVILMVLTFIVVVASDVAQRYANAVVPSWLVVLLGLMAGALLWPAG